MASRDAHDSVEALRPHCAPAFGDRVRVTERLASLGYEVRFRDDVWVECRIAGHGESWHGAGATQAEAFGAALGRMLPSHAARTVFAASLVAPEPAVSEPDRVEPQPVRDRDGTTEGNGPKPAEIRPAAVAASPTPPTPPPAPRVVPVGVPRRTAVDAHTEFDLLEARVDSGQAEGALGSAVHQRWWIACSIVEARALEESCPDSPALPERVHALARRLSGLAKRWWPGSVRALQKQTTPAAAAQELGLELEGDGASWSALLARLRSAFESVLRAEAGQGLDEDGWADPPSLAEPPPSDPGGMLHEVRAALVRAGDPLDVLPPDREHVDSSEDLLSLARRLRWLRLHTDRFEDWGEAVGRLRRIVAQRPHVHAKAAQTLDAEYCPPLHWPRLLGVDADKRRKQETRRRLLDALRRDPPTAPQKLATWLVEAFAVFDTAKLVPLLATQRDEVLALEPAAIGTERGLRARLRRLQGAIAGARPDEQAARRALDELTAEAPSGPVATAAYPHDRLLDRVRPFTAGRRAILITNRGDGELRQRLQDELGLAQLDWSEGEPRRVQATGESLRRGGYDLVLSATGFQSHAVDASLAPICRQAGVPYVRVNRARPLAVLLALERDLAGRRAASG